MPDVRIIKKYPNRRLYDTTTNAYITLADIKQLVFDRVDFQVVDARTNKDLTQSTLLQIITEQEANATPLFTTAVLQDFIRFYHEKSQDAFSQYLEKAMQVFAGQKDFMKTQWETYEKLMSGSKTKRPSDKK